VWTKAARPYSDIYGATAIRTLIEQNRGAVERLANVEKVTFAKGLVGEAIERWRHTARFRCPCCIREQIDAAVDTGASGNSRQLRRGLRKETRNGQRQLGNDQFLSESSPAQVVERASQRAQG